MPIHSPKNEYQGVNAHLHSYFQAEGGWSGFHTMFIASLAREIKRLLPAGYIVDIERSLQIKEIHPDTGEKIHRPEPDLTIYQQKAFAVKGPAPSSATLVQTIAASLDLNDELYHVAAVIYEQVPHKIFGDAVTRIELLSPTNKNGEGYLQYREKRYIALKTNVALVEIDFLHESPSVVKGVLRYPKQPESYPYHITVSDPHPSFDEGESKTFSFHVDMPIPPIPIPLTKGQSFELDFNPVYRDVYESLGTHSIIVDYEALPLNFQRYSDADQERIKAKMAIVKAAQSKP